MTGVAGPFDPDATLHLLRAALDDLDVVRPEALRAPIRDLLRAAVESITRYRSTLGLKVVHELELARVIVERAEASRYRMRHLTDMTARASLEETDTPPGTDHADRLPADTRPATSDRGALVHFIDGPWQNQVVYVLTVTAPVFNVGDDVGKYYWLDQNSNPPTYVWDEERR